jgi:hypothetical protein
VLIPLIWGFHQEQPPFLDETGISGNIDLTLDCILSNWKELKHELNRNGLDLVPGKAMMKVIIIRDNYQSSKITCSSSNEQPEDSNENSIRNDLKLR